MRRVAVIGCGGSGKTTLAKELAACLDLPVVHIDSHYWRTVDGERVESTPEQWRECHRDLIAADAWVIDGMKLGVLAERLARGHRHLPRPSDPGVPERHPATPTALSRAAASRPRGL
jgi:adenylate kinase family enzyme